MKVGANITTDLEDDILIEKDENKSKDEDELPPDHYNKVYMTFLIYGVAVLLPWNAICSVWDFF
jgi:hypothetical protein